MTISKQYIKNTLLIGISFILLKSFNLVLPYFLDEIPYNEFNKVFYYASLISTIGTLGFTYAITQINFTPIILSLLVILNILLSYFMVYSFSGIEVSIINLFNIFLISFVTIIFSIHNFRLLFYSETNKYFITILIMSAAYFTALAMSLLIDVNLFFLYGIFGLFGLIFSIRFFEWGTEGNLKEIKKFYRLGLSTFVINSAAVMIVMADKFFANNVFSIEVANAYTFAWLLVAPIFYLGGVAEKNIYAANNKNAVKSSLKNSFGLIALGLIGYSFLVYLFTNYFQNLFPEIININLFAKIFHYMMMGYALFIFLHHPINGVLFKLNFHDSQKITSYLYLSILGIFAGLYYSNLINIGSDDYLYLITLVVSALLILAICKFLVLLYLHKQAISGLFEKT